MLLYANRSGANVLIQLSARNQISCISKNIKHLSKSWEIPEYGS